jgi:hypothetical protein
MDTQIIAALKQIKIDLSTGAIATSAVLANRIKDAVDFSNLNIHLPKVSPSEPPSSFKFNKTIQGIEDSLKDREYIFDLLLAASVFDYDTAMCMLNDLEDKVLGLADSVKTLYFFSEPTRAGVNIVSTDFRSGWGIFKNGNKTLYRDRAAGVMLPVLLKEGIVGKATLTGDGIPGDYFLVSNGEISTKTSLKDKVTALSDGDSLTSFEYEHFRISQATASTTGGFGFGFSDSDVKWASTGYDSINLSIDLVANKPQVVNYILVNPGSTKDIYNISSIVLYAGGVEALVVQPRNVIINPQLSMHGEFSYLNYAAFLIEPTLTDDIKFKFRSETPFPCMVRHAYYVDDTGNRIAGIIPSSSNPHQVVGLTSSSSAKLEDLPADRFYIGFRDVVVQCLKFGTEGSITSDPIVFYRGIDRVALEADYSVPVDTSVEFQLSFNGGEAWHKITPLGSSVKGQVIAINDMIPDAYQDPSTNYIVEGGTPNEFLVRISCTRNKGTALASPIIRSIKLEVTLKQ